MKISTSPSFLFLIFSIPLLSFSHSYFKNQGWITLVLGGSIKSVFDDNNCIWIGTLDGGLAVYREGGVILDVEKQRDELPYKFELAQNYPNPFNPKTKIKWSVPNASHQTLRVFDILGQEVAVLVDENREAGFYEVEFDGSKLSSGIYFYQLQAGKYVETKKMVLMK